MRYAITLFCLFIPLLSFCQRYPTGKGTYRAGGGGSMSVSDKGDFYSYKIQVTPRFGYFVTDRVLTGFTINYAMEVDTELVSALKFNPLVKYYYPVNDHFFILGTAEYGLDRNTTFGYDKTIIDHSSVTFGPGVSYFFSRRVGFEINILTQLYFQPDAAHNNKVFTEGGLILNILNKKDKNANPFKKKQDLTPKVEDDE